jgi:hypothetical protein
MDGSSATQTNNKMAVFWDQQTNEKNLTKGGVLRKRETSSLVRFDNSWLRNALLEMVNGALKL